MSIFTGHWRRGESKGFGDDRPSDAYIEWLNSSPSPGEVLVDTGLSSAVDCRKLRQPLRTDKGELDREIARMALAVEHMRELFESGDPEAEAERVNNLVAVALVSVGLDPERFGVSLPQTAQNSPGIDPSVEGSQNP
jgi:hypothetical protein